MSAAPDAPFELVEGPKDPDAPEDPRTTTVKQAVAALAAGDDDAVRARCDPGFVYTVRGRSPLGGEHRGRDALIDSFRRLRALCDEPPRFDLALWLSAGAHVHVVGALTARRGGRVATFSEAHVFEVSDAGSILTGRVYEDDLYAFDAFFGVP